MGTPADSNNAAEQSIAPSELAQSPAWLPLEALIVTGPLGLVTAAQLSLAGEMQSACW